MKLLDAHSIAQDIIYANKRVYEYRDKVGKQLVRVLSEHPVNQGVLSLLKLNRELTKDIAEKMQTGLSEYYQELYRS